MLTESNDEPDAVDLFVVNRRAASAELQREQTRSNRLVQFVDSPGTDSPFGLTLFSLDLDTPNKLPIDRTRRMTVQQPTI
jgi:hypothetical protein